MRSLAAGIAACISAALPLSAFAAGWVSPGSDTVAEAAIVIDADSGAVLWGKNISDTYYPASITKLMTALVVLENSAPDEVVTVAAEAVDKLEWGAVSVKLQAGDTLTVEDLLYAMLLRSANDAANALACHVSGSIEDFAALMTKRAAELGCKNTKFQNPSGLTRPENLTTAYDMALIGAEVSRKPEFLEIESHQSHKMGATAAYPNGFTVNAEHKMIVKGTGYTDSRVIGGKTGYITASGNTLVTIAEEDGKRLVAVVLKDKNPDHYKDTRMMLNFGFNSFDDYVIEDPVTKYNIIQRLAADKITAGPGDNIIVMSDPVVTLPKGADINEVTVSYDYNIPDGAPDNAVALLVFRYADVRVGHTYVINDRESSLAIDYVEENETKIGNFRIPIPPKVVFSIAGAAAVLIVILTIALVISFNRRKEAERRARLLRNRRRRLAELDMSEEDFSELVEQKQSRSRKRRSRHE